MNFPLYFQSLLGLMFFFAFNFPTINVHAQPLRNANEEYYYTTTKSILDSFNSQNFNETLRILKPSLQGTPLEKSLFQWVFAPPTFPVLNMYYWDGVYYYSAPIGPYGPLGTFGPFGNNIWNATNMVQFSIDYTPFLDQFNPNSKYLVPNPIEISESALESTPSDFDPKTCLGNAPWTSFQSKNRSTSDEGNNPPLNEFLYNLYLKLFLSIIDRNPNCHDYSDVMGIHGPLGYMGPIGDRYLQALNDIPRPFQGIWNQFYEGGVLGVYGALSQFGPLGITGPLGPHGGHHLSVDNNGQYLNKKDPNSNKKVVRSVNIPFKNESIRREYDLFELYTENWASIKISASDTTVNKDPIDSEPILSVVDEGFTNDTSFAIFGQLDAENDKDFDVFVFAAEKKQMVTISVIPEVLKPYSSFDFDNISFYDFDFSLFQLPIIGNPSSPEDLAPTKCDYKQLFHSKKILSSDSDHYVDHAQILVPEKSCWAVQIKRKFNVLNDSQNFFRTAIPKYRLFVTGSQGFFSDQSRKVYGKHMVYYTPNLKNNDHQQNL